MDDHIIGLLKRYLAEKKQHLNEFTMGGGAEDYAQYVAAVAKARAYTEMEEELKELERRFLED